jgi:hypothetical protein
VPALDTVAIALPLAVDFCATKQEKVKLLQFLEGVDDADAFFEEEGLGLGKVARTQDSAALVETGEVRQGLLQQVADAGVVFRQSEARADGGQFEHLLQPVRRSLIYAHAI